MAARRFWAGVGLLWLLAAAAYLIACAGSIAAWDFPDSDDRLRLVEVRDWLGGQAWRDVSQHRLNAPWGASMHWSRLVDLPIAAIIVMLRPLIGASGAEQAAVLIVPALTLGIAMGLAAALGRRLIGPRTGLGAALLLPLTTGAMQQLRPLRIDHHGWQMVLALGLVLNLLDRDARRGGRIAGALAAVWLTISLEGLPVCAAAGVLLGWRWLTSGDAEAGARLRGFAGTLPLTAALVFALLRPAADWRAPVCDALSPVHLLALGAIALSLWAATLAGRTLAIRAGALALAGAVAAALYVGLAPACTRGAFAALDPLVQRHWYQNVLEGLPVWRIGWPAAASAIGWPLVALASGWMARARSADRSTWADYLFMLLAATLATALVQRAGAVANVLALPAGGALMAAVFARVDRLPPGAVRVLGSTGALLLTLPPAPALAVQWIDALRHRPEAKSPAGADALPCDTTRNLATAALLPRSNVMAGIDLGPGLLMTTSHRVVASAHHRNVAGLHDTLATFLGTPEQARAILARRRIAWLVACPASAEMTYYRETAPRGFWAQLAGGRRLAWAERVRLPGSTLSVWRIRR
ncbi:hypothetical protein [Sphingomonas jatrophae]|uniref:4-amino-4-deoxy-L-arabinose transferase n=1 Tax=Sphingomonas jatrophae TaxID=1166337 RepID=A0A1I6LPD0_9SPHN|nr:hypothetical protein [Sphingomonas jatrophae]SFS05259.1 hypothetical protein SAMN05192580_3075 [Sphingomonas jatrophae]